MRYCLTGAPNDWSGWRMMKKIQDRPRLQIGDKVTLRSEFENTFYKFLSGKTLQVDEIRPVNSWTWLPFDQFIGIAGDNKNLFGNTIFEKA